MTFKPNLCYKLKDEDLTKLRFPLIVQPKIDGIRCCIIDGVAYSRTLKKIPNDYVRSQLFELWKDLSVPYLIDGELIVGDTFQNSTSGIMTKKGKPNYKFIIFDRIGCSNDHTYYQERLSIINVSHLYSIWRVKSNLIYNMDSLLERETEYIKQGYEGIILRNPWSSYKFGRSTLNEQGLMALKRFEDAEAKIIGFEPKYRNENEIEYDERGYAKRSSHDENMVKLETLGAFKVVGLTNKFKGVEFKIGTGKGLNDELRKLIWDKQEDWINMEIKYKYQAIGSLDKPRLPQFIGLRKD